MLAAIADPPHSAGLQDPEPPTTHSSKPALSHQEVTTGPENRSQVHFLSVLPMLLIVLRMHHSPIPHSHHLYPELMSLPFCPDFFSILSALLNLLPSTGLLNSVSWAIPQHKEIWISHRVAEFTQLYSFLYYKSSNPEDLKQKHLPESNMVTFY